MGAFQHHVKFTPIFYLRLSVTWSVRCVCGERERETLVTTEPDVHHPPLFFYVGGLSKSSQYLQHHIDQISHHAN